MGNFFPVHNFRSFIQIITRYCVAFNWKRDRDAEQINTFRSLMVTTATTMAAVTLIEGKMCKPSEWWWILRFSSSTAYYLDNQSRAEQLSQLHSTSMHFLLWLAIWLNKNWAVASVSIEWNCIRKPVRVSFIFNACEVSIFCSCRLLYQLHIHCWFMLNRHSC